MATLEERGLRVKISFTGYSNEWVDYAFAFFYAGIPIFNNKIVEYEAFSANEHRDDSLIPHLETALLENKEVFWEPTEPDISIEIKSHLEPGLEKYKTCKNIYTSSEFRKKLEIIDERRAAAGGSLPEDDFELTFLVDTGKLPEFPGIDNPCYTGQYLTFRISVSRVKLEKFVSDLKQEYKEFCERHKDEMGLNK